MGHSDRKNVNNSTQWLAIHMDLFCNAMDTHINKKIIKQMRPPLNGITFIMFEQRGKYNANRQCHLLLAVSAKLEDDVEKLMHLELPLFQLATYYTL